jgi:protoheme ferro-lyase
VCVQFGPWALALLASTVGGVAVCAALVVPRRWVVACMALAVCAAGSDSFAWTAIWSAAHRADGLIAAIAISIASAAGGFALGAAALDTVTARHHAPSPAPQLLTPGVPGTHVIVLADAEPERYDPAAVTAQLGRFEDGDLDLPPELARPLIYASERSRFQRTGGSPARDVARRVAKALHARLVRDGSDFGVATAFCSGGPSLREEVNAVLARGGRRIVVAPLTAAWSPAFTAALGDVPVAALAAQGVEIEAAPTLWASEHLSAMVAQRVASALGADRSDDGVVLISEGDPWEEGRNQGRYCEELTFLIQRVRAELIGTGVAAERIMRGWLWFGEPDVAEAVRHLAAVGARNIVVVPVTYPTETISTLIDARYATERASTDTGAAVRFVAPWGNDPAVVESLADAVATAMERMD